MSLIDIFSIDLPLLKKKFKKLGLKRSKFEIIEDFHSQTVVEDCLDFDDGPSFQFLFNHLINGKNEENSYKIVMNILSKIVFVKTGFL